MGYITDYFKTNGSRNGWYGGYNEDKYKSYRFWHDGIGNLLTFGLSSKYIDYDINEARATAYMRRYGLTYTDIVNPANLYYSEDPVTSTTVVLSENLKRLYK